MSYSKFPKELCRPDRVLTRSCIAYKAYKDRGWPPRLGPQFRVAGGESELQAKSAVTK